MCSLGKFSTRGRRQFIAAGLLAFALSCGQPQPGCAAAPVLTTDCTTLSNDQLVAFIYALHKILTKQEEFQLIVPTVEQSRKIRKIHAYLDVCQPEAVARGLRIHMR